MRKNTVWILALLLPLAALGVACGGGGGSAPTAEAPAPAPAPSASAPAAPAGGSGSVKGVISYADGDPDTAIKMDADPVCAGLHTEPAMTEKIVGDGQGHLANVFIYVKSGLSGGPWPAPATAATIDQHGCQYHPHVQGVMVGQKIEIVNSDSTLHNIHAHPTVNAEFNQGQPFQGMKMEHTFDKPEVMIPFRCDVHPWMASYMAVLDNPFFAVSKADGSYEIPNLPAGTYTLEAWHEELGTQTMQVTVAAGGAADANFDFKPKA
jgi:plastocyanin